MHQNMPFQGTKLIFFLEREKPLSASGKEKTPPYGASILVPSALVPLEES